VRFHGGLAGVGDDDLESDNLNVDMKDVGRSAVANATLVT